MKKYYFILFFIWAAVGADYAQDDTKAKDVKQNFVTPDHPAFKILGTDPSNILRPSNIKEFSTITGDYFKPPAYVIPRSFSAEISPALLARSNKLTVVDYAADNHWVGYGCRISLATQAVDDKWQKRELGVGFRMTVIDKGDFRRDVGFLSELAKWTHAAHLTRTEYENNLISEIQKESKYLLLYQKYVADSTALAKDPTNKILEAALQKSEKPVYDYIESREKTTFEDYQKDNQKYKAIDDSINKMRDTYKANNWNANRLDWGIAAKFITPDTAFSKNMQYNKASFWLAGSKQIKESAGKAQQQLLFGLNINSEYNRLNTRDTILQIPIKDTITHAVIDSTPIKSKVSNDSTKQSQFSYSFSARYYIGTNKVKGFIELQAGGSHITGWKFSDFENKTNKEFAVNSFKLLLNAGIEANITDGVWLMANAGYKMSYDKDSRKSDNGTVTSKFVYQLNFRFNIPEKFKLF